MQMELEPTTAVPDILRFLISNTGFLNHHFVEKSDLSELLMVSKQTRQEVKLNTVKVKVRHGLCSKTLKFMAGFPERVRFTVDCTFIDKYSPQYFRLHVMTKNKDLHGALAKITHLKLFGVITCPRYLSEDIDENVMSLFTELKTITFTMVIATDLLRAQKKAVWPNSLTKLILRYPKHFDPDFIPSETDAGFRDSFCHLPKACVVLIKK